MAAPRFFFPADAPLPAAGESVELPPAAVRHVQVLRLQPGSAVTLFDGRGGEAAATLLRIGRRDAQARIDALDPGADRELPLAVTLAVGVPANDRMDALVEKATELGAAAIRPLVCQRSVLRLEGDRADKRLAHWQAVAAAACEQCGRNRLPAIAPPAPLAAWLRAAADGRAGGPPGRRWLLSPAASMPLARAWAEGMPAEGAAPPAVTLLSGPEGGLSPAEETLAGEAGFAPVGLGTRVLRADTAPLAALAFLALHSGR